MSHTADDQNEVFDIVDRNDNVVGRATREEVHKNKKLIHRSIGVAIFNDKGELFLQQRSFGKDTDPGKWTISCSGHVGLSGYSFEKSISARRQNFLARKTGKFPRVLTYMLSLLKIFFLDLSLPPRTRSRMRSSKILSYSQNLSSYRQAAHRELQEELGFDLPIIPIVKYLCYAPNETEISMLYKARSGGPFILNTEEIIQGKFFTRKKLTEEVKSGKIKLSFMGKVALEKLGWKIP